MRMVEVNTKLKDIPRKEIDALEGALETLVKKIGRFAQFGKERETPNDPHKPFARISFVFGYDKIEAIRLEAKGKAKQGDYEVQLRINLPADIYSLLMQNLEAKAPILSKSLPKIPSYNH